MKHLLCILILSFQLCSLWAAESWHEHKVQSNETLYSIAGHYNTDVQNIMAINNLTTSTIRPGQIILVPVTTADSYTVVPGDNLESIAKKTGTSLSNLMLLNGLTTESVIFPGQILDLSMDDSSITHTVSAGETLSHIALQYRTTVAEIRRMNGLSDSMIRPGQVIRIPAAATSSKDYIVREGETLWNIAQNHHITVEALLVANQLGSEIIHPGDSLIIPSAAVDSAPVLIPLQDTLLAYYDYFSQIESVNHKTGPYYNYSPRGTTQPDSNYMESDERDPARNYRMAREVLSNLDRFIDQMKPLGNELTGYTIVLDPGHGGDDPGFLQQSTDGSNFSVFIAEDEYNYDITMRIYRLLKLHGAQVELTLISPNHHIRSTPDPSVTFINEKNEVYNSSILNRSGNTGDFPDGNGSSLNKRMRIINNSFIGVPVSRRLFVSIHMDHNPNRSGYPMILYWGSSAGDTQRNAEFADTVAKAMGNDTVIRQQNLYVLRNNPAYGEILIEVRNVSDNNDSWAIRNEELREQDAIKIVNGIINYAESNER